MADAHMRAIGRVLREWGETFKREILEYIESVFDNKVEVARLNAELWKEQQRHRSEQSEQMLQNLSAMFKKSLEQFAEYEERITALTEQTRRALEQIPEHLGPYVEGRKYRPGQSVMRDGATFMCVAPTTADPREKLEEPAWRLLAQKGEQGKTGEQGQRGPKGMKGDTGRDGKDGASISGVAFHDWALVVTKTQGEPDRIELKDMRDAINAMVREILDEDR